MTKAAASFQKLLNDFKLEQLFNELGWGGVAADIPTKDKNVVSRIEAAISKFRRYRSSQAGRRTVLFNVSLINFHSKT